jgi:general secretion pathway protein D
VLGSGGGVLVFAIVIAAATSASGDSTSPFRSEQSAATGLSGWAATVVPGSGDGKQPAAAKARQARRDDGDITLNFSNADVGEVVQAVLGDLLHLNYAVSPKVKGQITIRTSQPLSHDAALPALEEVLRLHGIAVVKSGNLYQVIPAEEAPRGGSRPQLYARPEVRAPGYGIDVVPLKFVSASQMEKVLKAVSPEGSVLYADPGRNLLLLGGAQYQLDSLLDMVAIFDVPRMSGMSFALLSLDHSDPDSIVSELARVYGLPENAADGAIRFLPIKRLNAVLVIAADQASIDDAEQWVTMLDRRDEASQRLYVYYLQNGRADDVANTLGKLFGADQSQGQQETQTQTPAEPPNGAVAPGYGAAEIGAAIMGGGALPGTNTSNTASLTAPGELSKAPPAKMSPTEAPQTETTSANVVQFMGQKAVRIVADTHINALVIYASPADYQTVLKALQKIDIAPMQVLIEATIAEVTLSGDFKYGLEWFFNNFNFDMSTIAGSGLKSAFQFMGTTSDFHSTLTALSHQTDVNIISSPQLMVLDNQTARIQIGDQVPVLSEQAVSTLTAGAPVVNSVQYIDTGVILEVKPHVSNSGSVTMEITQQISSPQTTQTSDIDSPTIQQRLVTSSVSVQSGATVALAGLISDRSDKNGQGLPLLRRIPVVGPFFGTKGRSSARTELLVLITPKVVRDSTDAREVSYELGSRMRSLAPLGAKIQ